MIFADKVFREDETKKVCIIGIFSEIRGVEFPVMHPLMAIYQRFTDMISPVQSGCFEFRYLDGEGEPLFRAEGPINANSDRLGFTDVIFNINGLVFPRPGRIEVSFSLDGDFVNQGTFVVAQVKKEL